MHGCVVPCGKTAPLVLVEGRSTFKKIPAKVEYFVSVVVSPRLRDSTGSLQSFERDGFEKCRGGAGTEVASASESSFEDVVDSEGRRAPVGDSIVDLRTGFGTDTFGTSTVGFPETRTLGEI